MDNIYTTYTQPFAVHSRIFTALPRLCVQLIWEIDMSALFILLALAWLAFLIPMRISALVGRRGAMHRLTRGTKQAIAYRKRLERNLHVHP